MHTVKFEPGQAAEMVKLVEQTSGMPLPLDAQLEVIDFITQAQIFVSHMKALGVAIQIDISYETV